MIRAKDIQIDDLSNQEKIMSYYLGLPIDLNRRFLSPFRVDKSPSCSFYYTRTGALRFHDWGVSEQYGAVEVVMKKFGISYGRALDRIRKDMPYIQAHEVELTKREDVELVCIAKDFPQSALLYWKRYHIGEDLLSMYNVSYIDKVYRNDKLFLRSTKENPIFAYPFNSGRIKLYRPLSPEKGKKWYGNSSMEDIGGKKQLPKKGVLCIVTSSIKDVMVLRSMGFPAVCMNGEGYGIGGETKEVFSKLLKELRRKFRYVISMLDSDDDGLKFAYKLSQVHGLSYVYTPIGGPKDISDYVHRFGKRKGWNTLKKIIKSHFKH